MTTLQITEQYIDFQAEQIFVKIWAPLTQLSQIPIVLVHDSLGCVDLWREFPKLLAQSTQRKVIAYDRWGFGKSSARIEQISHHFIFLEAQQSFKAVIDALQLEDYIVLGHSVGGGMAVCVAEQYPQQCKAVISIAAQALVEKKTTDGVREAKLLFKAPTQFDRLVKYHGDKAKWVLEAWTETWLSEPYQAWTLEPNLNQVKCPLLVIHGEHDEYGSIAQPKRMAEIVSRHASAFCEIIPEARHVPHRDQPEAVLAVIQQFLIDQT